MRSQVRRCHQSTEELANMIGSILDTIVVGLSAQIDVALYAFCHVLFKIEPFLEPHSPFGRCILHKRIRSRSPVAIYEKEVQTVTLRNFYHQMELNLEVDKDSFVDDVRDLER